MSETTGLTSEAINVQPSFPVTPKGWQILVRLKPFEEKKGALYIPKTHGEMHNRAAVVGEVIAKGPDTFRQKIANGEDKWIEPSCGVGDWIMFESYSGVPFKYEGIEHRLMPDESVLAVVEPSKIDSLERI